MTTIDQPGTFSHQHLGPSSSGTSSTAWMPLDGLAQQWATFAGTFPSAPAFTATSAVFSALSLEAGALQEYDQACRSRFNGHDLLARAACEQVVRDLQEASLQWMTALSWLERLASDRLHLLEKEDHAALRRFFSEATEQLQRVGVLTQQVQAVCVLCYQQHGMLIRHEEEGAQS